ncbi:MAG: bifunctional precorrin-2 dehydrogenase/sirohydrochlorin ferrochelatase [Eubacteriales bacterium]|nr:bifunctional precorrin-2 dehydrogenase/sirohydrochlorin ferrochelatase [Eubacteriales bacterium]
MAFFPILIQMRDLPVLIAGGGNIATHKAELLSSYGAALTVVAPEISDGIAQMDVKKVLREVTEDDCVGKALVVDATGSEEAGSILKKWCAEHSVPYNCAWRGDDATAIFPAILQRGRTTIAVSTRGASPAACAWIRDSLYEAVPECMDEILERMSELRVTAKDTIADQKDRSAFLHRCLSAMLEKKRSITDAEASELMDKK